MVFSLAVWTFGYFSRMDINRILKMEERNLITLSEEGEETFLGETKRWTDFQELYRKLDYENHDDREERKILAGMRQNAIYNKHVQETNWVNRIGVVCFIVITVVVVKVLLIA